MNHCICLILLLAFFTTACDNAKSRQPITLHPDNPHYFLYDNKPTVLITSAEHYGALLNLDVDYNIYLETLAKDGLNLTRTFSGVYLEPQGAFNIEQNVLAPVAGKFICPWKRSDQPGYIDGGNKYDLSQWDEAYFKRLHEFMRKAEQLNVVVEFVLFCPFYEDSLYQMSPMHPENNVNHVGPKERAYVYTIDKSEGLLNFQEALVRKLVGELKDYSNLIYEICNEPYFGGVTIEWQHHIASLIEAEEKALGKKHLISQNIANGKKLIEEPHPAVSVFNFHYAFPPVASTQNYHLNKVIGDNETGFDGNADSTYRREGWSFILNGGALYNNLDYSFTANHEDGTFQYPSSQPGGGSPALRNQLGYLQKFISGFDFIKMKPDSTVVSFPQGLDTRAYALSEPGRQYAIYVFGKGPHELELKCPAGTYNVVFMDPRAGSGELAQKILSDGKITIQTPAYLEDVAIEVKNP